MNKNNLAAMSTGRRCIRQELIAFFFQARDIGFNVIGAKAQVVNAARLFLEVFGNWPFAVKRIFAWGVQFSSCGLLQALRPQVL